MLNLSALIPGAAIAALLLGAIGCEPSSPASHYPYAYDPYARLTCSSKLDRMARELRDFEASKKAAAKRSALTPSSADTATDSIPPATAAGPNGRDTLPPAALPASIVAIQIVATEPYRAHIVIYDYRDLPIRTLDAEFGYRGEFDNRTATGPHGLVSYLVWDKKDATGRDAPDGVYLWKMRFEFESGAAEDRAQLTGLLGAACEAELAR